MTIALRETLELVEESVNDIAKRTSGKLLDNPLDAAALKTLIHVRLQDLSKHKEIALTNGILRADEAADIMNLESSLAVSLARCEMYLENPDRYREYVVYKKATVNRWKRRFTRLGVISLAILTAFVGIKVLRTLRPAIQRLDL